jgi:hypothetical protein
MKFLRISGIAVKLTLQISVFVKSAYADWWVGNSRLTAYGVKANIRTPSEQLYIEEGGESNWVSLPSPYWLQTGWRYYKDWELPRSYVEWNTPTEYDYRDYEYQSWDNTWEYKNRA